MPNQSYESIQEVSQLLRDKKISPVQIVTECLDRIKDLQPQLNAFITVIQGAAMQEAAIAEREILDGNWKGLLHGIPVGVKDFYDTAGTRTTAAFEHFKNRIPQKNAVGVDKLKSAGAIIIGKSNMHTLGMGTTGLESSFGAVQNPWNLEYIPGGSSSGSAAAVAAGLCYATLDTDAIGSCRLPAACCGVVGFKGTYGLIDMKGILEGEQPPDETILWMAHAAITTRRVEDTAIVLDVLAVRADDGRSTRYRDVLTQGKKVVLGIAQNLRTDTEVSSAFDQAVEKLRSFGYPTRSVTAPFVDFGRGVANIQADRNAIFDRAFKDIDVLVLPTVPTTTPLVRNVERSPQALSAEATLFANYYGLPAISVPCGFDRRGLPLGMQIVGKPYDDCAVLRLAHQYEQATGHGKKRPIA